MIYLAKTNKCITLGDDGCRCASGMIVAVTKNDELVSTIIPGKWAVEVCVPSEWITPLTLEEVMSFFMNDVSRFWLY